MDNVALNTWFIEYRNHRTDAMDVVYVNGGNTLNMVQKSDESWVAKAIEPTFRELMFDTDIQ